MSRTPTSEDCAIITVIPVNSTVVTITTAEAAGRPERRGPAAGAAPIGHDLWILVRCTGAVGHLLLAEGPADDRAWDDHQAARTCSPPSGVCLGGVVLRHCQLIDSTFAVPGAGSKPRIETSHHSAFNQERADLPPRLDLRRPGQAHQWLWEAYMLFLNSRRPRGMVASPRLASAPGIAQWRCMLPGPRAPAPAYVDGTSLQSHQALS